MNDDIDIITHDKLRKLQDNMHKWRGKMNDFEVSFCSSLLPRFRSFGPLTKMSPKQRNVLADIVFKFDA